jgi:hypothetical protein
MDLEEVGWADDGLDGLMMGIEPSGYIKCWETIECPNN